MKKIALILALTIYTIGSVSVINSSKSFAAFPISQTTTTESSEAISEVSESSVVNSATTASAHVKVKAEKKHGFFNKMASKLGSKSQIVAAILCFFLGGLGIHRFYLGYTWQGIVQLLTAGGCGIWALIDFIRIILGDLGPKDGSYDKTF